MNNMFITTNLCNLLLLASLVFSIPASARGNAETGDPYKHLSNGNRQIADALYSAQTYINPDYQTVTSNPHWSRSEIAVSHLQTNSWGSVFRKMKDLGLLVEATLGEVLNRHHKGISGSGIRQTASGDRSKADIVITTASGEYIVVGRRIDNRPNPVMNDLF